MESFLHADIQLKVVYTVYIWLVSGLCHLTVLFITPTGLFTLTMTLFLFFDTQ